MPDRLLSRRFEKEEDELSKARKKDVQRVRVDMITKLISAYFPHFYRTRYARNTCCLFHSPSFSQNLV
jgi:hypothetical protein